ncbi:hypothetical protein E4U30_008036 [Claviceps sp. LM220 group G6]|nr:hypothetical protein E4U30_008036 [Claviceps sp. LM220 group G6]
MASRIRRNWQATTDGQLFKDTIFWFAHYISYEIITDFVRNCVKQLPDRYLILPPFGQKTVNQESRRTRTSYTPAEDAALLIYVESHTKDRIGNQIYKVFAESFEAQESERTSSTARSEEDRAESEVDYEDQIDQFYRKKQHEVRDYG